MAAANVSLFIQCVTGGRLKRRGSRPWRCRPSARHPWRYPSSCSMPRIWPCLSGRVSRVCLRKKIKITLLLCHKTNPGFVVVLTTVYIIPVANFLITVERNLLKYTYACRYRVSRIWHQIYNSFLINIYSSLRDAVNL